MITNHKSMTSLRNIKKRKKALKNSKVFKIILIASKTKVLILPVKNSLKIQPPPIHCTHFSHLPCHSPFLFNPFKINI